MLENIKTMDELVEELRSYNEVVILGNSPHINQLDWNKVDNMLTIGVNRIGLKYDPDILLWSDCLLFTGFNFGFVPPEYRERYHQILIDTKSKIKLNRKHEYMLKVDGSIEYMSVNSFGHTWHGGLKDGCPSVCAAMHLAMIAEIDDVYICGVDMASNKYFWGEEQLYSENGEWNKDDKKGQYTFFKAIQNNNYFCRFYMCSPEANIPGGYLKTDYLNVKT